MRIKSRRVALRQIYKKEMEQIVVCIERVNILQEKQTKTATFDIEDQEIATTNLVTVK